MKAHEGYILIDHRASPGTDAVPEGTVFEAAAMQCAHCNSITIRNPSRTRERASCSKCGGFYICDTCAIEANLPHYTHKPYTQKTEETYTRINNG